MTPKQKYLISPGTALEYSPSTAAVLSKKLPYLPEEQIRQKEQAEKNAVCTVNSAEGVRTEELKKLPYLPEETSREECSMHNQLSRKSVVGCTCRFTTLESNP
ncbi:hypothetical protein FF2_035849 [Malus domestica]